MARLVELTRGASVNRTLPAGSITARDVRWFGAETREAFHADQNCVPPSRRRLFMREPAFGVASVDYDQRELWERGEEPAYARERRYGEDHLQRPGIRQP